MAEETQPGAAAQDVLTGAFSVVLTSCGRFDLLKPTVESLLTYLDEAPEAFIIVEDSGPENGAEQVRDALAPLEPTLGKPFEILINPRQLGQIPAIDRAYASVKTPLVFHCEDDWEFYRGGFIGESRRILAARPEVSMVGLRPREDLNPLVRETPESVLEDGRGSALSYLALDPKAHPEYFSYSFNPGLRRYRDYARLQPFTEIGHEAHISYAFKEAGFRIATLAEPAVRHIGGGAHVHDPNMPRKAKGFSGRLIRSVRKRVERLQRYLKKIKSQQK